MATRKPKPRRSAKIERQLAVDALAGKRAGRDLLLKGLRSFLGLSSELGDARTRIRLPYGARVDLIHDGSHGAMLAFYIPKKGAAISTQLPEIVAGWILDRAHGKVDVIVRALMGIERARRALLDSAEEKTRWL
jgi:hypothetical protein